MRRIIITILILLPVIMDCSALNPAPKGRLVYCSYSSTGMAGLGKDWCELIADVDSVPKVVVCLDYDNRFDMPEIMSMSDFSLYINEISIHNLLNTSNRTY